MGRSGGNKKKFRPERDVKSFIDRVNENKELDDITRQELIKTANDSLSTFNAKYDPNLHGILLTQATLKRKKAFESALNTARTDFDKAISGTDTKYRHRAYLQRKRELLADRPGRQQTILTDRTKTSVLG